ncbi:MAG: transglutaminase domain-containing protein [Planctomycetaceae bacterium]|nr:transglutaminase domain-containing protein [Planctomycetaceae bacterium]
MPLHLALAVALGVLSFLSTLMLGMGQGDVALPVLIGIAAIVSFVLTDYRRGIQLGDWTVNAFAITIVCFNIVDVLHHHGEYLAWSIARVLVFIQIVLLFREKEPRFCWQILLISLLQVVVSTVFHQSILFGVLLLLYVFVGLCAFILLFLQQEHRYFRRHSFTKTLFESIKAEMSERHDRGKLVRLALITLLMGPLTLVLSFGKKQDKQADKKSQRKKILRELFLIFPTEEDLAHKEHWESVEDEPDTTSPVLAESVSSFHAVPHRMNGVASSFMSSRFPLLAKRPSFSAGTRNPRPWSGNWWELFIHLTLGTIFAFFVASLIFCLIPRVGQIDYQGYRLKNEFEQWSRPVRQQISVGTVGINEEIQLGSLGSVLMHHREVIKVRFLHHSDNSLLSETESASNPYRAISGATLYFRGIPLDTYSEGSWTQTPVPNSVPPPFEPSFGPPLGTTLYWHNQQQAFFEDGCDLVTLAMTIQPLETQVFFAPHPFFSIDKEDEVVLRTANGRSEESRPRRWNIANKTIATAVFKLGYQLDVIPCQELIDRDILTQIPHKGLDGLKALAAKWDAESKLPKSDIIGRARFMEQQFLLTEEFAYQLGGTIRDYDLDPLEDFISHNPRGHCEYFAGALALMLRSVGIGSRVIIGFKTEATDYNASCTVRQSDAHAWVEVYLPPETMPHRTTGQYAFWWQNGGWLRLDPTPASESASMMTTLTLQWTDLTRYIESFWNEFVLNMNSNRQMYWVYEPLRQAWHAIADRVFNVEFWKIFWSDMTNYYQSFFSETPQQQRQMGDAVYLMPPFIILGLLGLASWRLMVILRSSRRKQTAEEMRRRITIEFYLRMERMLTKIGLIRKSALTPLEFARQSSFAPLMLPIVEAFYRVRFGNVMLTEEESKSILQTLEQLERAITTPAQSP